MDEHDRFGGRGTLATPSCRARDDERRSCPHLRGKRVKKGRRGGGGGWTSCVGCFSHETSTTTPAAPKSSVILKTKSARTAPAAPGRESSACIRDRGRPMRAVRAGVMMILHCMLRRPRGGCGCVFEIRVCARGGGVGEMQLDSR